MGQIIKYTCKECGYESQNIYEGVGFGGDNGDEAVLQRRLERQELSKEIQRQEHGGKLLYEVPSFRYDDNTEGARRIYQEMCESGICPKCRKQGTLTKHGVGLWD